MRLAHLIVTALAASACQQEIEWGYGERDSYGSCVSSGLDCYASCGVLCDRAENPDPDAAPDPNADPDPDPDPNPDPAGSDLTPEELDLIEALNDERATYGLPPVEPDDRLMSRYIDSASTRRCAFPLSSSQVSRGSSLGIPDRVMNMGAPDRP